MPSITRLYANLPVGYITRSTMAVLLGGTGLFAGVEYYRSPEIFHRKYLIPLVHRLFDEEKAHRLGVNLAKFDLAFGTKANHIDYPVLHCTLFGRELDSPIGLAAGFDKNGEAVEGLSVGVGFSFVEVGTVTPKPQPGNPKPRVFRLVEDQAVINSYGFNSDGVGPVVERVGRAFNPYAPIAVGINLGKNKTTEEAVYDYEIGVNYFSPYCHYLVLNISSPNTPGLRALQSKRELSKILSTVHDALKRAHTSEERPKPKVFVKISPDLTREEMKEIVEVCTSSPNGADGLIVANTTTSRPPGLKSPNAEKPGGLSGAPLRELSTKCVSEIYRLSNGKIPIIGCGGVSNGADAYEKIRAGASGVQIYTALVYQGFPVVGRIKRELAELLKRDGYKHVGEAVGADHRKK